MISFYRTLFAVASLVLASWAQTTVTNLEIKDISPADCPVRMSGDIRLTETIEEGELKTSYQDHLKTINPTSKAVIAMVVINHLVTSYTPLLQENKILDAFFSHELEIAPGQ